jgi:hypothetical protein
MNQTDPALRALQYALLMAAINAARPVAAAVAPPLQAALGWPGVFVAAGGFQAAVAVLFLAAGRRERR